MTKRQLLGRTGRSDESGFTIVELLIVVVVIAILASISVVSYNGIQSRALDAAAKTAASQGYKKVETYAITNSDNYPADLDAAGLNNSSGTTYEYTVNNSSSPRTFCLTATISGTSYYVSQASGTPVAGLCSGHTGGGPATAMTMQTTTASNCPTTRTLAVDARDDHTYWIQKFGDGLCWMLTNLAYAGGGTNTYSDTKTLSNGTGDGAHTYTDAKYYIPTDANVTSGTTEPSTSTDGGVTNPQYGYLYNYCGANAGQSANGACSSSSWTGPDPAVSICPAGWRLPTGGSGGELSVLNDTINSSSLVVDTGLRNTWLGQYSGVWDVGFFDQGSYGNYWSSPYMFGLIYAYDLYHDSSYVDPTFTDNKVAGLAVRCVAP